MDTGIFDEGQLAREKPLGSEFKREISSYIHWRKEQAARHFSADNGERHQPHQLHAPDLTMVTMIQNEAEPRPTEAVSAAVDDLPSAANPSRIIRRVHRAVATSLSSAYQKRCSGGTDARSFGANDEIASDY